MVPFSLDHPDAKPLANVLILDGGMGTTLEDVFQKDISSPLWSAQLLQSDPDAIKATHLDFLNAGADIILTATYQCSTQAFARTSLALDLEQEHGIMRKGVLIADEARTSFEKSEATNEKHVYVALSLGPFGASLPGAQEFTGIYPPPYGPPLQRNYYLDTERDAEEVAMRALTDFHLSRLKIFAEDPDTWAKIDFIAFETVPLAREISMIRRAMGLLYLEADDSSARPDISSNLQHKPWWVSTVWPDGQFPQQALASTAAGDRLPPTDVLEALLNTSSADLPAPSGIGINCTEISGLDKVLQEFCASPLLDSDSTCKPFLVLYPNGGVPFDSSANTWLHGSHSNSLTCWAGELSKIAARELKTGVWNGVIVGGCCKTEPKHIDALRRDLVGR